VDADTIVNWALGFVTVWFIVALFHAFWQARDKKWTPLPPESPERHVDHTHGAAHHA
jgi:hypothetical protein